MTPKMSRMISATHYRNERNRIFVHRTLEGAVINRKFRDCSGVPKMTVFSSKCSFTFLQR